MIGLSKHNMLSGISILWLLLCIIEMLLLSHKAVITIRNLVFGPCYVRQKKLLDLCGFKTQLL